MHHYLGNHYLPSFHPTGISAAATCCIPLSVASKLYWLAAFLVSSTSILIPKSLMNLLVAGLMGIMLGPVPMISKSGFGQTNSNRPHGLASTAGSHCPFTFRSLPVIASSPLLPPAIAPSFLPGCSHGRHLYTSPPSKSTPLPDTLVLLLNAKPSFVVASMPVAGGGVFPSTFIAAKSVCVSSFEGGPRSVVFGARDFMLLIRDPCRHREQIYGAARELWRAVLADDEALNAAARDVCN
jgi:hypothetical protein